MRNREELGEVVFLTDERVFGRVVGGLGAHFTMIRYAKGGIDFEVFVENEDFVLMEGDIE